MAAWLSQRSTILSTFSASAINYSTLSGSAITLNSTMISLGTSTNSVYTRLSQGNFNSSVSTSSWVSSLTGRVSTTTVAMSANAQYQLALSQSSISTSVMFTSTLGTSWSTLSGATGLPNYSTISYTAGAISGTGQYGVLGTSAGQLLVTSTFGQTFSGLNTNLPYVYLPFENSTADQSGENRTVTATGTFTYGTGIIGLNSAFFNNTAGNNTASFYVTVPWVGALNFTITGWFNATSFSSGGFTPTIFATYSNSIRATISNTGVLTMTIPSNGSTATLATSSTLTTGTWYNYTFIFQTNGLCSFYLNNTLVGSSLTNVGGTGTNALTPIYLGSNGSAVNPFIGYMDDINIYTIAMPFTTLTSSVTPVPAIYLPLNTVPAPGSQSSGTAPATLTVVGPPTVAPSSYILGTGAIRVANTLGNVAATQYIRGSWSGATNFTVSFWFNTQLSTASVLQQVIFSAYGTSISITINTSNQLVVAYPSGTGAGQTTLDTSFTVALNTWYNITFIFQTGNICYLYVSNLPIISFVNAGIGSFTSSAFGIGTFDVGPVVYGFNGYIDDFKIYNSAVPIANLLPATVSTPLIYFTMDTVPTNATISLGAAPVSPVVIGTPTQAPSYIMGTGAINLTNTIGGSATQSIRIPWTIGTSFTWTFWFNTAGSGGQQDIITATFGGVSVVLTSDNYLFAYSTKNLAQTTFKIVPNTWYSVVFIYQLNSTGYFYVNNQLIGTFICPSYGNSSETVTIGSNNTNLGDAAFSGYIDDFKIYNTAIPFTPMYPPHSFTSTTVSNSGQYMLATITNGGLYMSSNFGGTFSPVTGALLNALWSNAHISATGQYMLVNATPVIVQPQLTGLPSSGTALTTSPWQANGITWTASASTLQSGLPVSNLFNNNPTGGNTWASNGGYTITDLGLGDYTGSVSTSIVGISNYLGEWIQIQSSAPVVMYSYSIAGGGSAGRQVPRTYTILGSNDGSTWYQLQTATIASGSPYGSNAYVTTSSIIMNTSGTITVTGSSSATSTYTIGTTAYTTNAYTYFRLCVNKSIPGAFPQLEIGEWYINFQAGGQTYSTNYGATWSNYMPLYTTIQPQLSGIPSSTTALTTAAWQTNGVTWIAKASSLQASDPETWPVSFAFDNTAIAQWNSVNGYDSSGNPTIAPIKQTTVSGSTINGEWLQLESSTPLVMNSYKIGSGGFWQYPKSYTIAGSNDNGSTWFTVQTVTIASNPSGASNQLIPSTLIVVAQSGIQTVITSAATANATCIPGANSTTAFTYFRIIAQSIFGNGANTCLSIGDWFINFVGGTLSTQALSESGQYQLTANATVSPALLTQLSFENSYVDSAGGLATGVLSGITANVTFTSISKVGSTSLAVSNIPAAQSGLGYVNYTIPTGHPLRSPTLLTIAFWMYPTSISVWPNQSSPLGFNNGTNGPGPYFFLSSTMRFAYYTSTGTSNAITGTTTIAQSTWVHVAITYSNGNLILYVNGAVEASVVITGSLSLDSSSSWGPITNMFIGCEHTGYGGYNGYIDDVRIYNAGLTSTQIYTLYATTTLTPAIYITQNFNMNTLVLPTFTPALNAVTNVPVASAISNTGQYMLFITNNVSGNNVYYSMNYGATFTGLQLGTQVLTSCAISYDGSYITIASGATIYTLNNNSTGFSVALGNQAGYQNQALNSIAIGNYAGYQNQAASSIILNASGPGALGTGLNAVVQGFYVAPIASCVASSSQSFSILGYGTDNQVVQTGLTVLPDTGTFNLNAPVGSTTSGILSSRYYLGSVGDNQDANGIDNNVYGPWYGVGWSGIPGFTNVPCLCGFYGVSMRSGGGYLVLTEAGNVGIGTTNPAVKFQVGSITTDYGGSTLYTGATIVGPSVTPDLTSGTSLFSSLYVTTEDPMAVNKGGSIGFGSRQAFSSTNAMMGRITGTTNGSGISGDLVFEVLFNNTGRMYEKMRIVGSSGNVGIGITNPTAALQVNGSLAKSSGTFDIAHPLHPTTKRLVHSFIEGPRCDLIYRGTVALTNGVATVDINRQCTHNTVGAMEHGTFEALCANPDVFLQNRTGFGRVIGTIQGGTLTITCENNTATDLISWMVVAERADPFIKQWDRTDNDGYLITEYTQ